MKKQRLDKFISNQLIISRSVVRVGIQRGKATVNGVVVRDAGAQIEADCDTITYEGNAVGYKEYVYILMNKPKGVLTATEDKKQKTVLDLIPEEYKRKNLAPVGRLDKDTTGLLLITDDGVFAHYVISPKSNVEKEYIATLDGDVTDDMIKSFADGVTLADGTVCKPAKLERISFCVASVVIDEGKYHQIKRMFGTVGLGVNELKRIRIGTLSLPKEVKEGSCILLNDKPTLL